MDDRARRGPPAPYDTFEEASAEARALGPRNRLEYEYFVGLRLDPRLPKDPAIEYRDFHQKGGWDSFLGRKPIVRINPDPLPRPEPAPHPPAMEVPPPAVEVPTAPVAAPAPEEPIPLPGGAKPSVLTGRPRRVRPPSDEEEYEPPPPLLPKPRPAPPVPKKPKQPKMRREDLKTEEARRIYDMFACITGDWDD